MLTVIAAAAAFVLAQAAPPPTALQPSVPPPNPASAPSAPAKPRMICRNEDQVGSIIAKRVCRTPDQVEADRLAARREAEQIGDHLATCRIAGC